MSWYEYSDMYDKAQEIGNYKLFVFDVKDSRTFYSEKSNKLINDLKRLLSDIYSNVKEIELKENRKILHIIETPSTEGFRLDITEPFYGMGDLIAFTVLRGSISDDEVYQIFKKSKRDLNLEYKFHYASGYYETDNYVDGYFEYFRGYCIAHLESKAKNTKATI